MAVGGTGVALLLAALATAAYAVPLQVDQDKCGYESCPVAEDGVLAVHIVPHTHDDVGWLKTVDQYYYGSRNNIQVAGVQYILDSVIKELWEDPSRRFIYVETAFFWKWWQRQHDAVRHRVHTLVRQGRLEFIGGAWSMNDEADVHYQSTVDQFTWGLRKLNETFGECGRPRVAWQIDPFGHSRALAGLLAGMGYDGLFHGRIDFQDKRARIANRSMEMLWRGSDDLGAASDLFTGVLYNTYSPPPGFCFDILCTDSPIVDDPDSPLYNVDQRIDDFLGIIANMSKAYRTRNVLVTMGEDFNYQSARMWFSNLDLLIKYANMKSAKDKLNVKLFYSTPSCYLKSVHDAKPALPTKQDDFFPYASDAHAYWTGYFTSRPTIKYFERRGNTYLQMAKQLQVLARLEEHNRFVIDELRSAMGVMQHHDAVTGTEKQHVADDYARILDDAIEDSLIVARQAFSKLTESDPLKISELQLERCQFNISQCALSENSDHFIVTVYNPVSWCVDAAVRLPVVTPHLTVLDQRGGAVESQVVELPSQLLAVPTRHSSATQELVFVAERLPALGFRSYYVQKTPRDRARTRRQVAMPFKSRTDRFPPDIPVENFPTEPPSARALRDRMAIEQITQYYIRKNRLMRKKGYKQESAEFDEYKNFDSSEEKSVGKLDNFDTPADNFTFQLISMSDYRKMLNESERSLENFRRKYATKEKKDASQSQRRDRDKDVPYKFIRMSSMDEERMLGDDPMAVQVYSDDDYISNEHVRLSIDRATGEFTNLVLSDGTAISFDIDLLFYKGWIGDNAVAVNRASGAYIFRPNGTQPTPLSTKNTTKIIKGPVVQEIHHLYSEYASSVTRLYKNSPVVEFEWLVGPIPIGDKYGKEVIVRYNTNLSNQDTFYTDSNGRESLKRILNKRPQWNVKLDEPISGNYYPVTSKIHIEDLSQKVRMSVLNDRAQGGTSLNEGQIELMLHRRLLHDDAFGVGEALNETACGYGLVARGKHYISVGKIDSMTSRFEKKKAVEVLLTPEVLVSNASKITYDSWRWLKNEWSGLSSKMPDGLHLLTLEPWKAGTLLLRVENIYEKADLSDGNETISVDLSKLFANLTLTSMKEASLAANQWWADRKPLHWDKQGEFSRSFNEAYGNKDVPAADNHESEREMDGFVVGVKPTEIRTFVVEYEHL